MTRHAPLPFLLALAACASGGEEHEDPALHACEQVGVAGATVAAGATREEAAAITFSEEPFTVALADGAGWLSITVDEDTDALLFAGTADVVTGLYAEGSDEDVLPTGAPNEDCPEDVPEHFDLALAPGTWHLELGPSAVSELWLVLLAGGHAHEEG